MRPRRLAHSHSPAAPARRTIPYQIATVGQLIAIVSDPNLLDKHFVLTADIDLDPNLPGGKVFTQAVIAPDIAGRGGPRNYVGQAFKGVFDGAGHAVSNLTIVSKDGHCVGLFGGIAWPGCVRNLELRRAQVQGMSAVGSLAGENHGVVTNCRAESRIESEMEGGGLVGRNLGEMSDCHAVSKVHGHHFDNERHGGLVGSNQGPLIRCHASGEVAGESEVGGLIGRDGFGPVIHCYSTCRVEGRSILGGLIGQGSGHVAHCYATGDVVANAEDEDMDRFMAGGLAGSFEGEMAYCFATGGVSGDAHVGGLVGSTDLCTIADCYARGSVAGRKSVGGLIGYNRKSRVIRCYSTGRISTVPGLGRVEWTGGLIGGDMDGLVRDCFWDTTASGIVQSVAGKGLVTEQMQQAQMFVAAGWDFAEERSNGTADAWFIPEGIGYPGLTALSEAYQPRVLKGSGTADDPYQMATAADLGAMHHHDWAACYRLTADIDLAGITWTAAPVWGLAGTFDGAGFAIVNLDVCGYGDLGLFRGLYSVAMIRDLAVVNARVTGQDGSKNLGVLAAFNGGRVIGCYAKGRVEGSEGSSQLGGLVGYNYGRIVACYAAADVVGGGTCRALGGLVGSARGGAIARCYAVGSVTAEEGSMDLGGLAGVRQASVLNCFWDTEASGMQTSDGGQGLRTAEMKAPDVYSRSGWAGDPNWVLPGRDYPRLAWEGTGGRMIPEPALDWLVGSGAPEDPYQISTAEQLTRVAEVSILWDKAFVLVADLDLADVSFRGIGSDVAFRGSFDGGGHTLQNMSIGTPDKSASYQGLFGTMVGRVSDLRVNNATITGAGQSKYVGIVAGHNGGTISRCSVSGRILLGDRANTVGALVGLNGGTVSECSAEGSLTTGDGSKQVGGLIGENIMHVVDCYARSSVQAGNGSRSLGGLVGYNYSMRGGTTTARGTTYYMLEGRIKNCYAVGSVWGDDKCRDVGGLVGGHFTGTITSSFFLVPADGGRAVNDLGLPLTEAQMKQRVSFPDWDFASVWTICEGKDYPRLQWEGTACE